MPNLNKSIIIYFIFCALVLDNGAIPTALAKVFLVLGASNYLIPSSKTWKVLKPFFLWCILFAGFCVVSLKWAYDYNEARSWITTIVFVYICNISLAAILVNQRNNIQYYLKIFVYFGLLMCIYFVLVNGFHYGEDLDRTDTTINMNIIGMVSATTSVISFYLYKFDQQRKKPIQFLIIAVIALLFVLISASRKALLIPMIAYVVSKLAGRKPSRIILIAIMLGVMGCFFLWAVLNVPILYEMIGYRMEGMINGLLNTGGEVDASTNTRMLFVEVGMIFFAMKPWFGNGAANFGALYAANFPGRDPVYAHNNYVELLADYGIVGTLLYYYFYIFLIISLMKIVKRTHEPLAILFLSLIVSIMIVEYGFVAYYDLFTNIILTFAACYVLTNRHDSKVVKFKGSSIN